MAEPKKRKFSLYLWLLKKLRKELIIWYFFTFFSSFFYYQAAYGIKLWGYKETNFPRSSFFGIISINSRAHLLWYSFFYFFIGYLLTNLICEYYRNYNLELGRFYCRKLILKHSAKNPQKSQSNRQETMNNFCGEVELFAPLFISVPQRIFTAIINIIFTLVFLTNLRPTEFSNYFIIFVSLAVAFLSFLAYQTQSKINQRLNKFRQQENAAMEKYLVNQTEPQKVESIINSNFRKTHLALWRKSISYLPAFIIPGLIILFCFIYSSRHGENWEIKEFVQVYAIAGSIQTIFWKVKDINDNLPEASKIRIYHKSLHKVLDELPPIIEVGVS